MNACSRPIWAIPGAPRGGRGTEPRRGLAAEARARLRRGASGGRSTSWSARAKWSRSSAPTALASPRRCVDSRTRAPERRRHPAGRPNVKAPERTRARAGVALVPEGRQVFPELTVRDNLLLGAYRAATSTTSRNRAMLTRFPRLRERIDSRAGLLSGGEQQMLAVARGLMATAYADARRAVARARAGDGR